MAAIKYNFELNQGETFEMTLTVLTTDRRPYNLSGFTVRSQAKNAYTDIDPIVTFTTEVVDPPSGKIRLSLTDEQTSALEFTKALYDVEIESETGFVTRVLQGTITLSREVTK